MDNNRATKEEDLDKLHEGKQESQRIEREPGVLDFVFNSAIAFRLHAHNEI